MRIAPSPDLIDLLAPYAWELVENYDARASTLYLGDLDDVEAYLKSRFEFVLRVLIDIASLPTAVAR